MSRPLLVLPFFTLLVALLNVLPAHAADFELMEDFPRADPSAFSVVATGLSDGRLLVWNGNTVYLQSALDEDVFPAVASGYIGDPSFITLSPDGKHALLGAGFSGNLYLFDTENPADFAEATIVANVPHYAAIYLTETLVLIDAGVFGQPSELTMLDLSGAKGLPKPVVSKSDRYKNLVVQKPEGSYSASLALDARYGIVYAMDANTNELRYFTVDELVSAFNDSTTLDWAADGDLVGATGDYLGGGIAGVTSGGLLVNGGFGAVNLIDFSITAQKNGEIVDTLQPAGNTVFYTPLFNAPGDTIYIYVGDFTPESTLNGDVYRVILNPGGEGEGEGEGELADAAEALLNDFAGADSNADGFLTFAEARASLGTLTEAQYAALDQDEDGLLSEAELEAKVPGPGQGCVFTGGGDSSLEEKLSQLLVFLLAIITLAGFGSLNRN